MFSLPKASDLGTIILLSISVQIYCLYIYSTDMALQDGVHGLFSIFSFQLSKCIFGDTVWWILFVWISFGYVTGCMSKFVQCMCRHLSCKKFTEKMTIVANCFLPQFQLYNPIKWSSVFCFPRQSTLDPSTCLLKVLWEKNNIKTNNKKQ